MSHYHVTKNTPGYLPWTGFTVENKTAAVGALLEEKRMYLTNDYEGVLRFTGNARDLYYEVTDTSKMYDLGFIIEAFPCDETDCEMEGDY